MSRTEQPEWLESFLAVADHRSFSAAAAAVHRSQSRVSAHVASLERSLGAPLFDRRHRPIRLTDAGEAYQVHARAVLDSLLRGAEAIAGLAHETQGVVVVGAHPSASAGFLVQLIAGLSRTHPDVRIELTEGTTSVLTEKLVAGHVDLAVRNTWPEQPDLPLTYESLWHEPFVAVMPEDHPLTALPEPLAPEALSASPLISIGRPGNRIEPEVARIVKEWDADLDLVLHTEQPQTLANLVRARMGIGLINALAMQVSDTDGLALRRVGLRGEGRTVGVWWDQDRYMSSATRVVLDAIREAPVPDSTRAADAACPGG